MKCRRGSPDDVCLIEHNPVPTDAVQRTPFIGELGRQGIICRYDNVGGSKLVHVPLSSETVVFQHAESRAGMPEQRGNSQKRRGRGVSFNIERATYISTSLSQLLISTVFSDRM